MKKNETEIGKLIVERGITKQFVIKKTGINRADFYKGLKYPIMFTAIQLKRISEATGIKLSELKKIKAN